MSAIHIYAMLVAIGGPARRHKPLKTLLIILLVLWITPSVLLFVYLAWKGELLARYAALLQSRLAEMKPSLPKRN